MNLTISLTSPILSTGQLLKVEYSTDGVSYTLDSYQTSNSFTTAYGGFVAGTLYYFRFTLVKNTSPMIECDSVVKTFKIPEHIDCVEFSAQLTNYGDIWILELSYAIPSPYSAPCSFIIKYGTAQPLTSISYTTLPASPIVFPATNQTYFVEIYSVDCNGNVVLCQEIEVTPTPTPCTHAVLQSSDLYYSNGNYFLQLVISPSVPASSVYYVSFQQSNNLISGTPDSGNLTLTPSGANPETFTIQVFPNLAVYNNTITYTGGVTDACKWTSYFDKSVQGG